MLIKTLKAHPHGGRTRKVDEEYECPTKKARLLITIGKAEEVYGENPHYLNRQMTTGTSQLTPPPNKTDEPTGDADKTDEPTGDADKTDEPTGDADKTDEPVASPAAQDLAKEKGVDLSKLKGTGHNGMITKKDVETAIK